MEQTAKRDPCQVLRAAPNEFAEFAINVLECSFSEMRLLRVSVKNCLDFLVQTLEVYTHELKLNVLSELQC